MPASTETAVCTEIQEELQKCVQKVGNIFHRRRFFIGPAGVLYKIWPPK